MLTLLFDAYIIDLSGPYIVDLAVVRRLHGDMWRLGRVIWLLWRNKYACVGFKLGFRCRWSPSKGNFDHNEHFSAEHSDPHVDVLHYKLFTRCNFPSVGSSSVATATHANIHHTTQSKFGETERRDGAALLDTQQRREEDHGFLLNARALVLNAARFINGSFYQDGDSECDNVSPSRVWIFALQYDDLRSDREIL